MAIRGSCPACGLPVQVPEELSGRKFRCGKCGVVLLLAPESGQFVTEPTPLPAAPAPSRTEEGITRPGRQEALPRAPRWEDDEDEDWAYRLRRRGRDAALARVRGPGMLLQVVGILLALGGVSFLVVGVPLSILVPAPDPGLIAVFLVGGLLSLAFGAVIFLGGTRMKALRSSGLAMVAVVLLFIAGGLACMPLMLVAIWPLVVLNDAEVKANFDAPEESAA